LFEKGRRDTRARKREKKRRKEEMSWKAIKGRECELGKIRYVNKGFKET
jgi:hypothetical protein